MKTLMLAEWIAPMDRPVLWHGAVVFDEGKIIAVGNANVLRPKHADATIVDFGSAVILPGLINAHTHLELSNCPRPSPRPDSFVRWIEDLMLQIPREPDELAATVENAIGVGVGQCLGYGVTAVGDISRQCHLTRPLLRQSPLRVVSYGEIQAMAQRRGLLDQRLAVAADSSCASDRLRIAITPHAPYSIEESGYRRCLQLAKDNAFPLATHLAETVDERAFLATHTGPFWQLWDFLRAWDDQVPTFTGGPIRFAASIGLLDYPTLLAHVNYCDDDELALLAKGKASVVYCPRTHAYFGHPPHRWQDMLSHGINVAIGTDSCASSPDLNVVDDLRLLHAIEPEFDPQRLWEMPTIRAARAIGASNLGAIAPGFAADFAIFNVSTDEPLSEILERPGSLPASVWIGGQRIR